MRGLGLVGRLVVVAVVIAVGSTAAWLLTAASTPTPGLTAADIPALQVTAADVQPGSAAPDAAQVALVRAAAPAKPSPTPRPQADATRPDSLASWAHLVAQATDIPQRALLAYGSAELAMRDSEPSCHLSWATLAGIGRVESDHGRFGGARILPNGNESKPIIGVPLDGTAGNGEIHAAGGGYAHAAGPMQFIPSTWRKYASDGNGDHVGDPENIDDATLTAARYLCVGGRDMLTPSGWWAGLFSYNNSVEYGQKVFGLADRYAHAAQRALAAGH
ncbi:MAG: lytic murein transglycosylase [Sciscionella sp.]